MTLLGLVSVVVAAVPQMHRRVPGGLELLPPFTHDAARGATLAVGVSLLMLAGGLRRRKRRAWLVAFVLTISIAVLSLVRGLDVLEAVLALLAAALLLRSRASFSGEADPRSWWTTLRLFVTSSVAAWLAGMALVLGDRDGQVGHPGVRIVAVHVLEGMVGIAGPVQFDTAHRQDVITVTLALLGSVVVIATLTSLLRPAGGPHTRDASDDVRLRGLLAAPGSQDSLGYFALRDNKSVVFSPSGKAAVAYRVVGGVSLASGDPVGDPEAWPGAIEAWLAEARRYAWLPAVLAPGEVGAAAYHRAGFDALELGDEAVLDVADFALEGRPMRTVRQAVNRVRRLGYIADVTEMKALTDAEVAELNQASQAWREGETERGFAMALGRFGDPVDDACVLVRARDGEGKLCALLHLVPWGRDGLSLDVMRRSPATDNGVIELMVVELLQSSKEHGVRRVSLNFAVFRSVFERGGRLGAGPVLRLWRRVLLGASRFWQIESLYRANAKYQPAWEPRYLCFQSARDLPRVSVAALRAEAFLPELPRWGRRPRAGARPAATLPPRLHDGAVGPVAVPAARSRDDD